MRARYSDLNPKRRIADKGANEPAQLEDWALKVRYRGKLNTSATLVISAWRRHIAHALASHFVTPLSSLNCKPPIASSSKAFAAAW